MPKEETLMTTVLPQPVAGDDLNAVADQVGCAILRGRGTLVLCRATAGALQ